MFRTAIPTGALIALALAAGCSDDPDAPTPEPGPGAALACASSGKNAYDTYGQVAFFTITKNVFARVVAELTDHGEANLGDSIPKAGTGSLPSNRDDLATFEGKVAAYFVWAYGGPADVEYTDGVVYDGPQDMTAAHLGMKITGAQYDYFVASIVAPALIDSGIQHGAGGAPDDIATCFAPVVAEPTYKASMVGK
jgi:hypothetical protein